MSIWCSFSIAVRGPLEGRKRFASAFRSTITEMFGDSNDGELYAWLDDGTWGETNENDHTLLEIVAVWWWWPNPAAGQHYPDLEETVLELEDCSEFRGSCTWAPPIAWLEKVSNLMPSLSILCRSTTEHELYEEYTVSSAEVHRLKVAVFDWETHEWLPQDPNKSVRN